MRRATIGSPPTGVHDPVLSWLINAVHELELASNEQTPEEYQQLNASLTAISGISVTAAGLALLDDANAAAQRATLGLGSAAIKELTDWVSYTPTFTGFGTVTGISVWSRRVSDTLHIRGKFTSGITTAVEARMTLGFNGADGGISSHATKVASIQLAGMMVRSSATATEFVTLIESNIGYITFGFQTAGSGGLTKQVGTALGATGDTFSFMAEVPIAGW